MFQSYFNKKKNAQGGGLEKGNGVLRSPRSVTGPLVFESCNDDIISVAISTSKLFYLSLSGLITENKADLPDIHTKAEELSLHTKSIKKGSYNVIIKLQDESIDSMHFYIEVVDYLRETSHCLRHISGPVAEYMNSEHTPYVEAQTTDLSALNEEVSTFFNSLLYVLKKKRFDNLTDVQSNKEKILRMIEKMQKRQLKLVKKQEVSTRNSILYLNILHESKNMILFFVNTIKSERDLYQSIYEGKIPASESV